MKLNQTLLPVVGSLVLAGSAHATLVAKWTFETSVPTTAGPHSAEQGSGQASASTGGAYSNPSGNGTLESFSANNWNVGDYFQFTVNTASYGTGHLEINWEQARSSTGPSAWKVAYSTDGSSFTDAASYSVPVSTWNTTTYASGYAMSWSASAVSGGLIGQANVYVRLIPTADGAAAGTSRVDDVAVSVVPEPHEYAILAGVGLVGFALWRRRNAM